MSATMELPRSVDALKPILIVRAGQKSEMTPLQVAHKVMEMHNLPYGLLPMAAISEFSYNPNDKRFRVVQPDECDATFGGHRIKLCREVSGIVEMNTLRDLKGVKVKTHFLWLGIGCVEADPKPGKQIHFRVGPFSASMDAQELWDYKFWAPAFHEVPEKEAEVPMGKAAEHFTRLASSLQAARGTTGARV